MTRKVFRRVSRQILRRLAFVVPLVVLSTGLPVVTPEVRPHVRVFSLPIRLNAPVRAPANFGLVGVSWPASSVDPSAVRVRTSLDGRRWTKWTTVDFEPDVGPDLGKESHARHSTEPVWVGRGRIADVRFVGSTPRGARVEAIDPGPDPTAPPISSAAAAPAKPGIITRAQWGADESIRRRDPDVASSLHLAVVHHTATADSYSKSQSDDIVRSIYAYHVNTNGWDDIGYNFLIDRYGQIFEGRYGGIDMNVIGAHAMGFNTYSTGISIIGTFSNALPPGPTMTSLRHLLSWRLDQGFVDPNGSYNYTSGGSNKYPKGQVVTLRTVSAHRNVGETACPGNAIYNSIDSVRAAAAAEGLPKAYGVYLTRPVITPNGDGISDGLSVRGHFSSNASWKIDVLNKANAVLQSISGYGLNFQIPWYGKTTAGVVVPPGEYRYRITAHNTVGTVRTAYIPFNVWRYPNGTYFFAKPSNRPYILYRGELRHPTIAQARQTRYRQAEAITIPDVVTTSYKVGHEIGYRDGSLVKVDGKTTFLISDGYRRPITAATMNALGYNAAAVLATTTAAVSPHPVGPAVTVAGGYPDGTIIKSSSGGTAWVLDTVARPLATANVRASWLMRDVDLAGPADEAVAAGTGSMPVGFRDGSLVQVPGAMNVYVIADGMRHVVSSQAFTAMAYNAANIRSVTPAELALNPLGDPIS